MLAESPQKLATEETKPAVETKMIEVLQSPWAFGLGVNLGPGHSSSKTNHQNYTIIHAF